MFILQRLHIHQEFILLLVYSLYGAPDTEWDIAHFVAMPGYRIFLHQLDDKRFCLTGASVNQSKTHQRRKFGTGLQTYNLNVRYVFQGCLKCATFPLSFKILATGVPQTHDQKNKIIHSTEGQVLSSTTFRE